MTGAAGLDRALTGPELLTDLVGGVVLLVLVDEEVLAVEGLAELAEEVAAAGGELVLAHQVGRYPRSRSICITVRRIR